MKRMTAWTGALLLAGAGIMIGCEESSAPNTAAPAGGLQQATQTAGEHAAQTGAAVEKKAGEVKEKAGEVKDHAAAVADSAQASLIEKAKPLIEEAQKFIKENKLDSAQGIITKLEEIKPKLPQSMQGQIDNLKSLLEKAKAAGGALKDVKLPGTGH
jgi:DNA anti-recombination protein RmuC